MAKFDLDAVLGGSPFDSALKAEGVSGQVADIARSIYQQESGSGKNTRTSNAGARGGMQIIPATFDRMADKGWAIDNPEHNARAGVRYIKTLYEKAGGDPALTAAGYYGGEGAINKARRGIAVSDPRNPKAPNTLQYGQQVAARLPTQTKPTQPKAQRFDLDAVLTQPEQSQAAVKPETFLGMDTGKLKAVGQGAGDLVGGLVRGAGSIGSTILAPYDMAKDAIAGKGLSLESNRARRAGIDGGLQEMGANPDSALYKIGKVTGEIAGTAGAGGVLANGVRAVTTAPRAVAFANALQTGGMRAGATPGAANMLARIAGGATTGGTMAGMVDPESAGTGALVGGALPPGLKVAGEAGKLIRKGAGAATTNILGASTGTGAESISGAFNAGKNGSTKFLDNMRGKVSFDDVVGEAKGALGKMREARAADYRSGMVDISNDKAVIQFQPIDDAMKKISQMGSYKGQQINRNAAGTVDDLAATIDNWRGLDPAEYHTPEGLDALKQAIGDIRDSTQFGTAARRATDEVYNAVKNQITAQAPTYAKVMKDYSEASALLKEIESGLSLGSKASKDTAVRKLQSLLRNNAQTNYGNRLNLASQLEQKGGADLMPALAGQSMSSVMPRGLSGGIQKAGALGIGVTSPGTIPALIAAAPFTSPRLVGEGLYGLGRLTGGAGNALTAGKQGLNRLAGPGLLEAQNALYRSVPVMATSANQKARQ